MDDRRLAFSALAAAFGALGRLRFWPGDRVRVYGFEVTYVRLVDSGFHIVHNGTVEQVAPPDSLRTA